MKIGVIGSGAVGKRVLRQIPTAESIPRDFPSGALSDLDLLVLANESSEQPILAGMAIAEGTSVLSTADRPDAVDSLLRLDTLAKERETLLIVGAAYSPGMSCVLSTYLAGQLDKVTEVHIARVGTGGPVCARNYHRSLSGVAMEYCEGSWRYRPGGSGRELYWLPEPLGGVDCYAAALPEPLLLCRLFGEARRITSKRGATRRDRFTAPFPMLRPPHAEGGVGGIRVEVRGVVEGRSTELTVASVALPAMAVANVLVTTIELLESNKINSKRSGAVGLGELVNPHEFLGEIVKHGIGISVFTGASL